MRNRSANEREQNRLRMNQRYATDPTYREKKKCAALAWSVDNPNRRKAIKAAYDERRRKDPWTWARHMASAIKCRCRRDGVAFSLTAEDLLAAIPADHLCPALGIPIIFGGRLTRNSPSVDRIIPTLGYIKGNIAVISHRANAMKQDASSPEELRRVADYMERFAARNILGREHAPPRAGIAA